MFFLCLLRIYFQISIESRNLLYFNVSRELQVMTAYLSNLYFIRHMEKKRKKKENATNFYNIKNFFILKRIYPIIHPLIYSTSTLKTQNNVINSCFCV